MVHEERSRDIKAEKQKKQEEFLRQTKINAQKKFKEQNNKKQTETDLKKLQERERLLKTRQYAQQSREKTQRKAAQKRA